MTSDNDAAGFWDGAEVIHAYTRAEALADGGLIDVSDTASEAGFRYPVAITCAAWSEYVAWDKADDERKGTVQDQSGRLWDVVWMAAVALRARKRAQPNNCTTLLPFQFYCVPRDGKSTRPRLSTLHLHVGPGDNAEPVLTIMLPTED